MAEPKHVTLAWIAGHVANEVSRLDAAQLRRWETYGVEPWVGYLSRRPGATHEQVFVIAEGGRQVLYYDDVEREFAKGVRIAARWIEAGERVGTRLSWALGAFHPEA